MPDLLNHPLIAQRYFFPRRTAPDSPFWVEVAGARLACHFHQHPEAVGTLIFFHGNGEVVADYLGDLPEFFARLGWNCLLAEYRGYGASSGAPLLGELLDDVPTIIAATGEPAQRIVLFGRSVGSIFAVEGVARVPGIGGLIVESGIADVEERLRLRVSAAELGVTDEEFQAVTTARLDQRRKVADFRAPALVMHAEHDELVDVSHGRRLHQWLGGEKQLRIFPHGGHNDISLVNARAYRASVADFLARVQTGG